MARRTLSRSLAVVAVVAVIAVHASLVAPAFAAQPGAVKARATIVLPVELPPAGTPKTWKMGWSIDDATYLRSIPRAARTVRLYPQLLRDDHRFGVPFADTPVMKTVSHKHVARFRSYEAMPGKDRWVPRKIWVDDVGMYEQWWLQDAKGFVAVISIHKKTGKQYYFEIRDTAGNPRKGARYVDGDAVGLVAAGNDHCYACHPSGLRKILPRRDDPEINRAVLRRLNGRIEKRGIAKFGAAVVARRYGKPVKQCARCHNGKRRGRLYPIHIKPIHYKLSVLHSMPPDKPLPPAAGKALAARIGRRSQRYFSRACSAGQIASCSLLGQLFADGDGGLGVDTAAAASAFDRACKGGNGVACVRAYLLHKAAGTGAKARKRALLSLRAACKLRQQQACDELLKP